MNPSLKLLKKALARVRNESSSTLSFCWPLGGGVLYVRTYEALFYVIEMCNVLLACTAANYA
jgi:hypothetical protein